MIILCKGVIAIRIIISPAKKMKVDNDGFGPRGPAIYLEETKILLDYLQSLSYKELKAIWKCSDKLASKNFEIIKNMDLENNLSPAVLSFEGLQYQYMSAGVFTYRELDYIQDHLRILSGFYGILKPFDGIVAYRLEMQAKLLGFSHESLYDFWKDKIAKNILEESDLIINLASKEYSKAVSKYLPKGTRFINCIFGELIEGKLKEKGTLAKMARGEMVRFMAEENILDPEDIKSFNRLGYLYRDDLSDENSYVFIKKED